MVKAKDENKLDVDEEVFIFNSNGSDFLTSYRLGIVEECSLEDSKTADGTTVKTEYYSVRDQSGDLYYGSYKYPKNGAFVFLRPTDYINRLQDMTNNNDEIIAAKKRENDRIQKRIDEVKEKLRAEARLRREGARELCGKRGHVFGKWNEERSQDENVNHVRWKRRCKYCGISQVTYDNPLEVESPKIYGKGKITPHK